PEGVFLRVNGEMCRLLGYTEQELVGMTVAQLTFEGDLEKSRVDVARLMRGDITTMSKQKLYRHKSGRAVPCNLQVRSVLDEVGMPKFMVSSVQDLSDAKFAEQKLIQASKMSSLGEMAGSIAHEINSPMAVIQLSAEQLEDPEMVEFFDKEDVAMIAKRITDTVERISKIIRGLKNFSRNAEHDAMETVSLASVIDDSLELCREKFKNRNIEIRMADLPEVDVLCRPTELCQVLLNLLSNAFDAIDERKDGERWVEISGTYRFSRILLNVTDSGPGIPKAVSDRMHEPFFTTKPLGKGTGLGLSISKGIVENHGGHITLDSACKNTRFVMDLPATISTPALASAPEVKLASGS
ncbi:MAG: PAS domain S-box protein, partial [Proteobacteria bacterium]